MTDVKAEFRVLTVQQPFAFLMSLPASDPRHKRVENRSWPTDLRGRVAIHAGLGRSHLHRCAEMGLTPQEQDGLVFGSIVCVLELVACMQEIKMTGLRGRHVVGPWCHIFDPKVKLVSPPIPIVGQLGYFTLHRRNLR